MMNLKMKDRKYRTDEFIHVRYIEKFSSYIKNLIFLDSEIRNSSNNSLNKSSNHDIYQLSFIYQIQLSFK